MDERAIPLSVFSMGSSVGALLGLGMDDLFRKAGIPLGLLADREACISASQYHELVVQVQQALQDPCFALRIGEWFHVERLAPSGPLFLTSVNLGATLQDYARFLPLLSPCLDLLLDEDNAQASCTCRIAPSLAGDFRFLHAEGTFSALWQLLRRATGRADIAPLRIELRHDAENRRAEFQRVFSTSIELVSHAAEDRIVFDRAHLDLRNPGSSPELYRQLRIIAEERLAGIPSVETTVSAVLRMLEERCGIEPPSLSSVSTWLNINPRTLQRWLKEEGASFQAILDGFRYRKAQALLRDPGTDIALLSATLGYSEPQAFRRAFRKWAGISPATFQKSHASARF